jgi:hypothetical protein
VAIQAVPHGESLVVIKNVGHEALHCYNGPDRPAVILNPGQQMRVRVEWMRDWFGDERSRKDTQVFKPDGENGERVIIQTREYEVDKLKMRWGGMTYPERWNDPDNEYYCQPQIEVYTLDGERVTTVLDDPEGKGYTNVLRTVDEQRLIDDELDQMRRRIAILEAQKDDGVTTLTDYSEDDLPKDDTPSPRSPMRDAKTGRVMSKS